jgi:hypothetical protein
MPVVDVRPREGRTFGGPGKAAEFLDLFLQQAGVFKESPWEAQLESPAGCHWDAPPIRVVGYKNRVVFLRVKPSLHAAVAHFARLFVPGGSRQPVETVYRRLGSLVQAFSRFAHAQKHWKNETQPVRPAAGGVPYMRGRKGAQGAADAQRRLEANRQRHRQLLSEMEMLDREYQELSRLLLTTK